MERIKCSTRVTTHGRPDAELRTGDSDYQFGAFELSPRRQILVHASTPVHIGSRALAILTVLVERAGDLVTKEKLTAAVWPTTFVSETNLKVNIANLRRALETHAPEQSYIGTVLGRGYRFVAPVRRIAMGAGGLPPSIPIIGRAEDLAAVQERLGTSSIVTVVGAGGIGKTALATAAAHAAYAQYPDGVSFVDLAKISAAQFIPTALAFALGVPAGGADTLTQVIHALEGQRKLLLIDNCEHLLPAAAGVIDQLSTSLRGVRILATSREPLRIRDENLYRLNPLKSDPGVSPSASEALTYSAVKLFVTRAFECTRYELSDTDAPSASEICRRLDGIPLAIELAATHIGIVTPAQLLGMLDDRFKVLAHCRARVPLRQQTLHATLDWSYNLLSDSESRFARALSVFAGAFGIDGAFALAPNGTSPESAVDTLSSLAAKSFLKVDWQESAVTYRLSETMRAYLLEQLRLNGEESEAKHRLATFVCALPERAGKASAAIATQEQHAQSGRSLDDVRSTLARPGQRRIGRRLRRNACTTSSTNPADLPCDGRR